MSIEKSSHLVWQLRVGRVVRTLPPEGLLPGPMCALVGQVLESKDKDLITNTMAACLEQRAMVCEKGHLWQVRRDETQDESQASDRA